MTGTFEGVGSLQFTPDNKYCYALSGLYTSSTTAAVQLIFNTNSEYIVGCLQLNMPVDDDAPNLANVSACDIKFNGVSIGIISGSSTDAGTNRSVKQELIIPPFTEVELTVDSDGNESDRYGSLLFSGKVHGAVEQENLEAITNNNKWASL